MGRIVAIANLKGGVAWPRKRGISRETLDRFGAGSGMAFFPGNEHQGKLEAIFFPYSRRGAVVNWKARALASKDFAQKSASSASSISTPCSPVR